MIGKPLPSGVWLTLRSLPQDTTEADLQDWLSLCGIELPIENIDVGVCHQRFAKAVISLDRAAVADLFRRATLLNKFRGLDLDLTFKPEATNVRNAA